MRRHPGASAQGTMNLLRGKVSAGFRTFSSASEAIAAVEFALLLPLIFVLIAVIADGAEALVVKRKLDEVTFTIADLITQRSELTKAEVNTILTGSASIILPYDSSKLRLIVSAVTSTHDSQTIAWSMAYNATAQETGSVSTWPIPSNIVVSDVQTVVVHATYDFSFPINLFDQSITIDCLQFLRPRLGATIPLD